MITASELQELMLGVEEHMGTWEDAFSKTVLLKNPDYNHALPETWGLDTTNKKYIYVPNPGNVFPGVGQVLHVETEGGEGQGDQAYMIFKLLPEDGGPERFFMLCGYYASFHGFDWDGDLFEVQPIKKVVDDWEKV